MKVGFNRGEKITSPGVYPTGKYILARDITVQSGNGLSFSGKVELNMNGKKITGLDNKNDWNYGILSNDEIDITSKKGGQIIGFRVGLKSYGRNSTINNISFRNNRYIGIMIENNYCKINNCIVENTGGVDDEPYAIGIQIGESKSTSISKSIIKNIYKQVEYNGTAAGEGLGINLSANSMDCKVEDCTIINNTPKQGTIGIFCGIRGGHIILSNFINNFTCGIGAVSEAKSTISHNTIEINSKIPDSYGVFGPICNINYNFISGNFAIKIESNDPAVKC
jgi:hypothetical protein